MLSLIEKNITFVNLIYKNLKNKNFYIRLFIFLEQITKCSTNNDIFFNALYYINFNGYKANIIKNFITLLKKNSKAVIKKVQIYFLIHNPIYNKYNKYNIS